MAEQGTTRPRRPPPPPPGLPRPRQAPAARSAPPPVPVSPDPSLADELERPARAFGEHQPLPWPSLLKDSVGRIEGWTDTQPDHQQHLLNKESSWTGMLTWAFGVIVLLLVVAPTAAIPGLIGPFRQPVSGAGYGPLIAIFAVFSLVVAVGGGLWMWIAMGRDWDPPDDVVS